MNESSGVSRFGQVLRDLPQSPISIVEVAHTGVPSGADDLSTSQKSSLAKCSSTLAHLAASSRGFRSRT